MSVKNVYCDCDYTLVDVQNKLFPGVRKAFREMFKYGYHIHVWSRGGAERAEMLMKKHKLLKYVKHCLSKPDILFDDSKGELSNPALLRQVTDRNYWVNVWKHIFKKDLSPFYKEPKDDKGRRSNRNQ